MKRKSFLFSMLLVIYLASLTVLLWDLNPFYIIGSSPPPVPEPLPDASRVPEPLPDAIAKKPTLPNPVNLKLAPTKLRSVSDAIVADPTPPKSIDLKPTAPRRASLPDRAVIDRTLPKRVAPKTAVFLLDPVADTTAPKGVIETKQIVSRSGVNPQPPPDLDPPTLSVNVPIDRETTAANFRLRGSVSDNTGLGEVKVNNTAVSVSPEGNFTATVPLAYGENEIRVVATDTAGNMDIIRFTIVRKSLPRDTVGPKIHILAPMAPVARGIRREIIIDAPSVQVSATVTDVSGVSEVKVDGIAAQRRGNRFTADVALVQGDNKIHITAKDKLGNGSDKQLIVFRPHSDRLLRKGKDYALLFAVEDYTYWPKLHKPVSDAETIQRDLERLYGFQTELIQNPTEKDIYAGLRKYAQMDYADDDQLFIFFAGHGHFDEIFKRGYLVARETLRPNQDPEMLSYVSHADIRDLIDAMPCKHIFLVLDTCYSGTFDRRIAMRGNAADASKTQPTQADIDRKFRYTTRWYLTSGGKEIVYDDSPFVHQFLEALRSKGGSDNILTIDEILSHVRRLVKPKPCAGKFGSNEPGSDFLFFSRE